MENGGEPSLKRIKTEPVDDAEASSGTSLAGQTRLLIDPQRVQHLQEIAKQFDSKHSKRGLSRSTQPSPKGLDTPVTAKTLKTGKVSSLETIIGRLNSETGMEAKGSKSSDSASLETTNTSNEDGDSRSSTKETGTQTAVSMVQLIKSIIRDRMKAFQDSVFKDAAVDNLMNGKLIELRKENKELKECLEKLQTKYNALLAQSKSSRKPEGNRKTQVPSQNPVSQVGKTPSTESNKTMEVSAVTTAINPLQVQPTVAQSNNNFIVLQSNSRMSAPPRTKPSITQPSSGIRPTNAGHPQANISHRAPNPHRVQPQQLLSQQGQMVQPPPQQQQQPMQMLVNVQGQVNAQGPLINLHGHPVNAAGVMPGQPQIISGQAPVVNASGQLVNSKGQPVPPISPQIRPPGPMRYGVPQYIGPASQTNVRPSASTQVVFASQGVRVTTDPRMTSMPPNYEQATGGQNMHYSHSTMGPRPRMAQPPPNYVMQTPSGPRAVAPLTQTRKGEVISSANSNPPRPNVDSLPLPPRLAVTISAAGSGIVLSWDVEAPIPANMPAIECYHLFAYQDSEFPPRIANAWKRIGVVKALPLPMACTLTQFVSGSSYHFAIMAVDMYGREGPMSNSCTIRLGK